MAATRAMGRPRRGRRVMLPRYSHGTSPPFAPFAPDSPLRPFRTRSRQLAADRVRGGVLFVYGTLLPGGPAHRRLAGLADLGPASVAGRLYAHEGYPGLRPPRGAHERVHGRLYGRLDAQRLAALDRYEDAHPHARARGEYRRVSCVAARPGGRAVRAWVYAYRHPLPAARRLADGRWPASAGAP